MSRATGMLAVVALLGGGLAAGCGGGSKTKTPGRNRCQATIGFEAPLGTALGRQQLAFARLAVSQENAAHGTRITLAPGDTKLDPQTAVSLTGQLLSRPDVVAVVGPAHNREVDAVGSLLARAGLAFVSGSATGATLTDGANPTFFRVVPNDALQGPQAAQFVVRTLRPRSVTVLEGRDAYSSGLARSMLPILRSARIPVGQLRLSHAALGLGAATARVPPGTGVVVLALQNPTVAQQVGRALRAQHRLAAIVGPDRLYAPGTFTLPGSFVSSPAPDITALPSDAALAARAKRTLESFGVLAPPTYAATQVVAAAIARVCRAGHAPSRSGVLAAVRVTDLPHSILGVPIRFRGNGDLAAGRWWMFRIAAGGRYRLLLTK
jgi:branched-chain amino acid transport system substrate-binding protein